MREPNAIDLIHKNHMKRIAETRRGTRFMMCLACVIGLSAVVVLVATGVRVYLFYRSPVAQDEGFR